MSDDQVAAIAAKLGRVQKLTVLSLSNHWKPAYDHRAAIRLWYREPRLVEHKSRTDNCWALNNLGLAVRNILSEQSHEPR